MSARGKFMDIEERSRRVGEAVLAGHIHQDLGTALIESAAIQFNLHHAGNCTRQGNLAEALEIYQLTTGRFKQFKAYLHNAQLTPEQKESVLNSLEQGFSAVSASIASHPSYESLSRAYASSGGSS